MRDNQTSKSPCRKLTPLTVGILTTVLAACGGSNGNMYTMTGGGNTMTGGGMTGGMTTPPSVNLPSPGATVNRTVSLMAAPVAGTGATITRVDFLVDGTV